MDTKYVESLVIKSKAGDNSAKEEIIKEFTPLIKHLSYITFINSYDTSDIQNECYLSLLKAINVYEPSKQTFVGYATNSIKNNLNYLIRKSLTSVDEEFADFEGMIDYTLKESEYDLLKNEESNLVNQVLNELTSQEYDLYNHLIVRGITTREYAFRNNLHCQTVYYRKKRLLNKIGYRLASAL